MYDILLTYISQRSVTPITAEQAVLIRDAFKPKKLRKKQYLLQEGDVCKYLSFMVKGAMRQYSIDEKGNEHIVRFGIEQWWMADRESFEMQTPSRYNIDAWEETELLQISRSSYLSLRDAVPAVMEMTQELDKRGSIAAQKRIQAVISYTAEERYLDLLKTHPYFLQRFPQHMIASYLGISAETLSRIRKQALSK
ncbi:cAMP-binding domain of CRP or a regulatory subunit of cAMP-dependent protein kinases [Chitinophaga rupis]|uniref:cAMP-binding domain of CRP or a regulatory subunit of cAMP-dependent protein kinases n=1 Tax=Chitinophaga rupis TaxID=573321 RepID=A0A1H7VBL6_9BACT|nr:Crp/Fnr family transcriptional regulator [Chitinophaga rupis]SEM06671.1 cAMP-binding domain of CRP or a regulatory subunit of cAMP-dependent protein kinases [Chitinophaga rupis]